MQACHFSHVCMPGLVVHVANCLIVVCRRNGFYLELLREMPDIEDIVVAEEQRSESFYIPLQVQLLCLMPHAQGSKLCPQTSDPVACWQWSRMLGFVLAGILG